jgi:hypothetical protein
MVYPFITMSSVFPRGTTMHWVVYTPAGTSMGPMLAWRPLPASLEDPEPAEPAV